MTKDDLMAFRTMELGKLAAEKINSYYESRNDRDISDFSIFSMKLLKG